MRFRISRRLKIGQNGFARVLHGQLQETAAGPLLRYHLAVKKEQKAVMSCVGAIYSMFFLVLLYANPPSQGQELAYVLPLLLPLLLALLMLVGIAAGRENENELLNFASKLANGEQSVSP